MPSLDKLFSLIYPEIQKIFLEVMQGIVDRAMLNEMVKAIEMNDLNALVRASGFTPATLGPILDVIETAYQNSAEATVATWPKVIKSPIGPVVFTFDMRNPVVEQNLKENSSRLITRISDEIRENVRATLEQGMIKGDNPRTTALNIVGRINPLTKKREGGVVGLTEYQTKTVANVQRYLEQGDDKYFDLALRDKRFDKLVKKAFDERKPLKADDVEKLTSAYKNRALKHRGDMIARTEASQAFARAEWAAHEQAIADGVLKREYIEKWWDDVGDGDTRTTHKILGQKYNSKAAIPFDDVFVSVSGARMKHPGDQSLGAPAAEIIACRCKAGYRVNWIKQAKDEDV